MLKTLSTLMALCLCSTEMQVFAEQGKPATESSKTQNSHDSASSPDNGLDLWIKDSHRDIQRTWLLPKGLENKRVVVRFEVSPLGKVLESRVVQSSGSAQADAAALAAINNAQLRVLPGIRRKQPLTFEHIFDFSIYGGGGHTELAH